MIGNDSIMKLYIVWEVNPVTQRKGLFFDNSLGMVHGFRKKGVFEKGSPWIFKTGGYIYSLLSMSVNLNFN